MKSWCLLTIVLLTLNICLGRVNPGSEARATKLGQNTRTAEDYNNRGLERQGKGDLEGAIDDYTKAVALKARPSTIATAYNNRANARMSKNDLEGAISDYSKAIELQPGESENFYDRGVARLSKGDNDGAIKLYKAVVDQKCMFPKKAKDAAKELKKLGVRIDPK